jgi:chemotaxis methyl-accepting protein methylase
MNATDGNNELFDDLAQKAGTRFGAAASPLGRARFLEALAARQAKLNMASPAEYASLLYREPSEWNRLWPVALASEGAFWRPAAQFEVARDRIAEWSIMAPERSLKGLSLGAGRGFETCSLAMMLEECGLRAKNWRVEIFGLDLNEEAVSRAAAAQFTERDMEWLPEGARRKWFTPSGGGWRFKSALAPPVTLAAGNAYDSESWPEWMEAAPFDLIFCRGLTWEAPPEAPRRLARVLRNLLAPTGFIFTGPGELFLTGDTGDVRLEEREGVTYYRRGVNRFKANRAHTTKKEKAGRAVKPGREAEEAPLSPLTAREAALLAEAEALFSKARPDEARALLIELITGQMDRGRSQPEALGLLAKIG